MEHAGSGGKRSVGVLIEKIASPNCWISHELALAARASAGKPDGVWALICWRHLRPAAPQKIRPTAKALWLIKTNCYPKKAV